jgi:hypothetical protein
VHQFQLWSFIDLELSSFYLVKFRDLTCLDTLRDHCHFLNYSRAS